MRACVWLLTCFTFMLAACDDTSEPPVDDPPIDAEVEPPAPVWIETELVGHAAFASRQAEFLTFCAGGEPLGAESRRALNRQICRVAAGASRSGTRTSTSSRTSSP